MSIWGSGSCRHNEVCDPFGDLASLVWSPVTKKPVVHDSVDGADTLIADMCVCGAWEPQTEALFDIRVWMTLVDARSYHAGTPQDVLHTAEGEKKCKYIPAGLSELLCHIYSFLYMCFCGWHA